jgi:hypothetical protein
MPEKADVPEDCTEAAYSVVTDCSTGGGQVDRSNVCEFAAVDVVGALKRRNFWPPLSVAKEYKVSALAE